MCWISPGKLCVAASLGEYVLRHPWELCLAYEKERMQKYKRLYVGVYLYIHASISIHVFCMMQAIAVCSRVIAC
jgi:hypothetical protein